jgi:hypothetical protein
MSNDEEMQDQQTKVDLSGGVNLVCSVVEMNRSKYIPECIKKKDIEKLTKSELAEMVNYCQEGPKKTHEKRSKNHNTFYWQTLNESSDATSTFNIHPFSCPTSIFAHCLYGKFYRNIPKNDSPIPKGIKANMMTHHELSSEIGIGF